jgi:dTDP-4-amino-4,6-dideoxygalactose transaminase
MIKFLDLYGQYLSIRSEIDDAISHTIKESAFVGGEAVKNFEDRFAIYQQAAHCVTVANGTDALEIAIESLGLPLNSEIIVPSNTFIASAEAVTRCGHKVVFADVSPLTYTIDVADVEKRITPLTKAIIAVHLYGHPCEMSAIIGIANKYNLKIVEDCAQSHGAEYFGRRVGALGNVSAFSFYPGKNLGAYGDGGAILTNNKDTEIRCRLIANHGRIDKYNHVIEGRNSRLDGIQAAILNVKIKYLDGWIDRRNAIAKKYISGLRGTDDLILPVVDPNVRHAFHLFVIRTKDRNGLKKHLIDLGIETGIHYPIALPRLAAYAYLNQDREPLRASKMSNDLLSLPIGEHLSDVDIDFVIDAIKKYKNT